MSTEPVTNVDTTLETIPETKGITNAAAKAIYKELVERGKVGEDTSQLEILALVEEQELWLSDEWTHVGHCIVVCLENKKLIDQYNKGNKKVMDALIGKTIKAANMTVDAELVKELMPLIIEAYFVPGKDHASTSPINLTPIV